MLRTVNIFAWPTDPCQIFKRIRDYTRLVTNLQGNQEGRTQIECWDLALGEEVIFYKPKITKVIPLGKNQIKRKPYKTGERPKKADLVSRWTYIKGEHGKDYGIVVGFKINRRKAGNIQLFIGKTKTEHICR